MSEEDCEESPVRRHDDPRFGSCQYGLRFQTTQTFPLITSEYTAALCESATAKAGLGQSAL